MKKYKSIYLLLVRLVTVGLLVASSFCDLSGVAVAKSRPTLVSRWVVNNPSISGRMSATEWEDAQLVNISSGDNQVYAYFKNDDNWL